ncbi:affinity cAMP-specific and IBMX-insensitive 3',5'-cyclic phosphodiesterase [Seminavis robusta]|uniref:Phosphodiesterase n=1 Tax=Seminavis robusta TaxID=568900 RepID=A0A9N8DIB1_9STRA|nr:affinity cAMP-specific and IBMX-insensitive 3',5'-cyclic phosphodiesterase [Seminavis robusta]|eukprot:Sro136_g064050.1 affinity cAMP-specific and IBMX-insensitive 3',5'-cyclic phosphodiesterase (1365) ;mRNA; f:38202-42296
MERKRFPTDSSSLRVSILLLILAAAASSSISSAQVLPALPRCTHSSYELTQLPPEEEIDLAPCVIADINPGPSSANFSVIPLVHVTPSRCGVWRDGAVTGVNVLNEGGGVPIGFSQDHFVKFRLVSVMAGSTMARGYEGRHQYLLRGLVKELEAPFIVGTCSFIASIEKEVAQDVQAILMAQVGPPSFYQPANSNPFVFGIHINSDTYPLPNVQALDFWAAKNNPSRDVPVRAIYRLESDFFRSTCQSAIQALQNSGFTNIEALEFHPTKDDNGDGIRNEFDNRTLGQIADNACPRAPDFHPALFVCTLIEHDILLERWRQNQCRPTSIWLTAATWQWAHENPDLRPYMHGGAQWHPALNYSDEYFDSGRDLLEYTYQQFGYNGSYDQLVSYTVPILFSKHLQNAYKVATNPNPLQDFATPEGRELLRRDLKLLEVDTIFGEISFDKNQRNVGRGAAGTQWLPFERGEFIDVRRNEVQSNNQSDVVFANALVSPLLQAETSIVLPSPSAEGCNEGSFLNRTALENSSAILLSACESCPIDTYSAGDYDAAESCAECPTGSTTKGRTGQSECIPDEELNFILPRLLIGGYVLFGIIAALCLITVMWLWTYQGQVLVRISQPPLLVLVILGCLISSLSILFLGVQAEFASDMVDAACMASPWLYGVGFAVTFGPLLAKLLRIMLVSRRRNIHVNKSVNSQRAVGIREVSLLVGIILIIEVAILTAWQIDSPSQWSREVIEEVDGFVTESVGRCNSDDQFAYFCALAGFQLLCLLAALVLAYQTRHIHSDFAESGCISLAVAFTFEVVLLAAPIIVLARENNDVSYIVRVGSIFVQNFAVLLLLFVPKMIRVRESMQDPSKRGPNSERQSIYLPVAALTNSTWDEAADILNQMLGEDNAMPEEQRQNLEKVKAVLLSGNKGKKQNKMLHVPKGLARFSTTNSLKLSVKKQSSLYILREYAGIDIAKDSSETEVMEESARGSSPMSDDPGGVYLLPEFEALPSHATKIKVSKMLSWSSLKRWDFNIFDLCHLSDGNPLLFVGWAVLGSPHSQFAMSGACGEEVALEDFEGYNFSSSDLKIPMHTLCDYLRVIQDDYISSNPYHNEIHAADVLQSLHALLQMCEDHLLASNLELFAILLSAAVHDVQHPGSSNAFQANARTDLALTYNDNSILENKHASHSFVRMFGTDSNFGSKLTDLNILRNVDASKLANIRSKMIKAVLHTDMSLHFKTVSDIKGEMMKSDYLQDDETRWDVLMYLLHMADISGQAKPRPLSTLWTDRVMDEFFAQGDKEEQLGLPISPNCDRHTTLKADSQIGFIKFVIRPAYDVLGGIIPQVKERVVPIVSDNLEYWMEQRKIESPDVDSSGGV